MAGNYHKQNFIINNNNLKKTLKFLPTGYKNIYYLILWRICLCFLWYFLEISTDLEFCSLLISVGKNLSCPAVAS